MKRFKLKELPSVDIFEIHEPLVEGVERLKGKELGVGHILVISAKIPDFADRFLLEVDSGGIVSTTTGALFLFRVVETLLDPPTMLLTVV